MNVIQQGARSGRHSAIPRTLTFLTRASEDGTREVLLLHGGADKRLWPGRYNGIGGHVEPEEDVLSSAARELAEEAGITGVALNLRGVVSVDTRSEANVSSPGILIFVFTGETTLSATSRSAEGETEWIPIHRLAEYPVVDDVPTLVALALREGPIFYGHYAPDSNGALRMEFR